MKTNISVLSITLAFLFLLPISLVAACECRVTPVAQRFEKASAVFAGKVIFVDIKNGYILFEVMKSWKAETAKMMWIQNQKDPTRTGGCDLYPKQDEEYLVFAFGDTILTTNKCDTKLLMDSTKTSNELNENTAL